MKRFFLSVLVVLINLNIHASHANYPRFYLVRKSVKKSYGFTYGDYLRLLEPCQRKHKLILIGPDHMEILYGRAFLGPFDGEPETVDPLTMTRFYTLLASRSTKFKKRFQAWDRQNLITDPGLLRLAHDLNSRRQAGDE